MDSVEHQDNEWLVHSDTGVENDGEEYVLEGDFGDDETALLKHAGDISSARGHRLSMDVQERDGTRFSLAIFIEKWRIPDFRRKFYAMFVLTITTVFMFADQNLLAPNLTAVAEDFNFSKKERDEKLGGQLAAAFFLVGAPSSIIIGHLSDTKNRIIVFATVVLIGEAPCFATYWVQNYTQLLILRSLTGVSVGGILPLLYSILGDMFCASHRSLVSAGLATAAGIGVALGQAIAGFIGPEYGWRLPFMIVSVPTILCAIVAGLTVREQERGGGEEDIRQLLEERDVHYTEKIDFSKVVGIFRNKTNMLVFLQGLPGCVPWGVMFAYFNDFLHDDKALSVEAATAVTLWFGLGAAIGNVVGGIYGQILYNRDKRSLSYLMGITTMLGAIPLLFVINASPSQFQKASGRIFSIICVLGSGILTCVTGANVRVLLLNVNVPEIRGTAFAVFNLSDDLGKGLGPFLVSFMISAFGRVRAFNIAMLLWAVTGLILLLTSLTIVDDVYAINKQLGIVVAQMASASANDDEL